MAARKPQSRKSREAWQLAKVQHGVVSRAQLLALGFSAGAIQHRLENGRLHLITRGIYAVGRPALTQKGRWMAAILACGPTAVLSGLSAAACWGICRACQGPIEITVTAGEACGRRGIKVRRRALALIDNASHGGIPVTSPILTLIDLAATLRLDDLERAVNEADRLDLIDPETLRLALERYRGVRGVARLRALLDRRTFTLTRSKLEQRFLPIAYGIGLPKPQTEVYVNGFEVDFYWPELGLVVETDGLRHHRTPAQQARDRRRDQAHIASGLMPLRFTHAQIWHERNYVASVLTAVTRRLHSHVRGAK